MLSTLALEDQLLLEACRLEITPEGAGRVAELICRGPDWQYVLEASMRHAVSPMLKHGLDRTASVRDFDVRVPEAIRHDLEALYEGSASRNARLFAALREVIEALRAAGVEPVGLKDIQLAVSIYPEPALRPMGDVDLLIRRADWGAAAESLHALGFVARPSGDVPYTRKYATGQHFRRARDEIWIDLQWNVMQREWDLRGEGSFTYDGEAMWRNAVPIQGLGFDLRAPALEDMLFHLCLHLEGHRYCELVLFCDIAELLRREAAAVRWDNLLELAQRYAAQSSLYYVLSFVQKLLDAPVPDSVLRSLEPSFFHGALHTPLFGNLTILHLTLDDIRLRAAPPQGVLDEYERVARRQAARAMTLDLELRGLLEDFFGRGGTVGVLDGAPSPRIFPDASTPAFEPIRLLVLADDRWLLEEALTGASFATAPSGEWSKLVRISSTDPVLVDRDVALALEARWSDELAALLALDSGKRTNASAAARSLTGRLVGPAPDDTTATVHLMIFTLQPEALVVGVARSVGATHDERLFRACSLIDLLSKLGGSLDRRRIAELATRHGVVEQVEAGLQVAAALTNSASGFVGDPHPRILEWARYGPDSVRRYPWLRAAYYFALTLLATPRLKGKMAYFGRSLARRRDGLPVLPSIALDASKGAITTLTRRQKSVRDFAYWIEPATAEQLIAS
jgi:hypothetical protein